MASKQQGRFGGYVHSIQRTDTARLGSWSGHYCVGQTHVHLNINTTLGSGYGRIPVFWRTILPPSSLHSVTIQKTVTQIIAVRTSRHIGVNWQV
jgi:hypothetical protein